MAKIKNRPPGVFSEKDVKISPLGRSAEVYLVQVPLEAQFLPFTKTCHTF